MAKPFAQTDQEVANGSREVNLLELVYHVEWRSCDKRLRIVCVELAGRRTRSR